MEEDQARVFNRYFVHGEMFLVPQDYKVGNFIHKGAFGSVVSGLQTYSNRPVAIKKCIDVLGIKKSQNLTRVYIKRTFRELEILFYLHYNPHPNLVNVFDMYTIGTDVYVIFELMDCDLADVIRCTRNREEKIDKDDTKAILYQLLLGLNALHSIHIVHRDLKPRNVLFSQSNKDGSCEIKLCDFGLSRLFCEDELELSTYVVTRYYRPPELLLNFTQTDTSIDIWGVGCILAEMLLNRPLFPGRNRINQIKRIINVLGSQNEEDIVGCPKGVIYVKSLKHVKAKSFKNIFRDSYDKEAIDLLRRCLHFNPKKRISAREALSHPFFKDLYSKEDLGNFVGKKNFTSVYSDEMPVCKCIERIKEMILKFNEGRYCNYCLKGQNLRDIPVENIIM